MFKEAFSCINFPQDVVEVRMALEGFQKSILDAFHVTRSMIHLNAKGGLLVLLLGELTSAYGWIARGI